MGQRSAAMAAFFSSLLRGCVPLSAIRPGKQTHAQLIAAGLLRHITLQTDLVLLYSRCSDTDHARKVFDGMPHKSMHSWNILISAYAQNSSYGDTFRLFLNLVGLSVRPDHFTLPSVFKACADAREIVLGTLLHGLVIRLGFEGHVVVSGAALDMYSKCGKIDDAYKVFVRLGSRDVVAWNCMISGLERAGLSMHALALCKRMQKVGHEMDLMAIPSILSACGSAGELMKGKELHAKVTRSLTFDSDIAIGNSLIDMYAKCGCLDYSQKVFSAMPAKNVVTWTTLISCYGINGMGKEALLIYNEMLAARQNPNCITFTSVLMSCSHSGLIDQGRTIFDSIGASYDIKPQVEHYACMVDLLGRSGKFEEAMDLINRMPMEPGPSVWGSLLGACVMHKNVKNAEIAANKLFRQEPENASNYVALCSIYDALGMWEDVLKTRSKMRESQLVKMPGCSWINLHGRVHKFQQRDITHKLVVEIYGTLQMLMESMMLSEENYG